MPNDTTPENKDLQDETLEDENVNIDDIEGLEKDIQEEEAPAKKEEVLYDDGPNLADRIKEIEDSIPKEDTSKEFEPREKKEDEYIEGHATLPEHDDHDDVEILEHEGDEEDEDEEKESFFSKLKDKKNLAKILIAILVILILIIALIFIFLPSKNDETAKPAPKAVEQTVIEEPQMETPQSHYVFKLDHINVTRVNNKLQKLTKYELLGMSEEEYLRQEKLKAEQKAKEEAALKEKLRLEEEEKARLAKEEAALKEKLRLEEEEKARLAKEEAEKKALEEQKANKNPASTEMANSDSPMTNSDNQFLKFVHVPTYKKVMYKAELSKLKGIDARINPCRNTKNFIEIFIGPLSDESQYKTIVEELNQKVNYKNIKMLELTKQEFEERCMVY